MTCFLTSSSEGPGTFRTREPKGAETVCQRQVRRGGQRGGAEMMWVGWGGVGDNGTETRAEASMEGLRRLEVVGG